MGNFYSNFVLLNLMRVLKTFQNQLCATTSSATAACMYLFQFLKLF